MALSDNDLAKQLSVIAKANQPTIRRAGNLFYITIGGVEYKLQYITQQVVRSQGVKSR
jgi:hypothetical protein